MRKIAIALSKGGTAKTTTAVNLAHGLARAGHKVLLVDCDITGQCTRALGVLPSEGLATMIAGDLGLGGALREARENLWILPAGQGLAGAQRNISRQDFGAERVLSEALEGVTGYDFVLLDTAPSMGPLVVNALFYANEVLCPVNMEPLALRALADFAQHMVAIQRHRPELRLRFVVPTFVDGRIRRSAEVLAQLREHYGDRITAVIRYSTRLSECAAFGETIFEFDPRGRGAEDYAALAQEVENAGT